MGNIELFILTTKRGDIYRDKTGEPIVKGSRNGIRRAAVKDELRDWKATKVSLLELQDIRQLCLMDLKPRNVSEVIGLGD